MTTLAEKEKITQVPSAEKELIDPPVDAIEHLTSDPQFQIEKTTISADGLYVVGTVLKGHEDDWQRPYAYDTEYRFGKNGEAAWAINSDEARGKISLVLESEDGELTELGVTAHTNQGVIETLRPEDNLYIIDKTLVDVMRETNTFKSNAFSMLMSNETPLVDIVKVSPRGRHVATGPSKPTQVIEKQTEPKASAKHEKLGHSLIVDSTSEQPKARDYADIDDLVTVSEKGKTVHRYDGKFYSKDELEMIADYQDQIRDYIDNKQTERELSPDFDPQLQGENSAMEGETLAEYEARHATRPVIDPLDDLVSTPEPGPEIDDLRDLPDGGKSEETDDVPESKWQRAKNRLRDGYLKAAYFVGEIPRRLGGVLPDSSKHLDESLEQYDRRMKLRGIALAVGVIASYLVLKEVSHGFAEAISGGGAGSAGGAVSHGGGHAGPDNFDAFRTGHNPLEPNSVPVETVFHTPEASSYADSTPWQWASDAFKDPNVAMSKLHELSDVAVAHGYNVEWLPASGGGEYIKINGASDAQSVITILRQYAG